MSAIHIAALKRVSEYNGRLEVRVAELEETLSRYQSGHQGACYACEPVGELNVKLEERVRALWCALDTIAETEPEECAGRLRDIANEALATTEDV